MGSRRKRRQLATVEMDQLTFKSVAGSTVDKSNVVRSMARDLWMVNLFLETDRVEYVGQCVRTHTNDINQVAQVAK